MILVSYEFYLNRVLSKIRVRALWIQLHVSMIVKLYTTSILEPFLLPTRTETASVIELEPSTCKNKTDATQPEDLTRIEDLCKVGKGED